MHEELREAIASNGGFLLRRDLVAAGYTDKHLRALTHSSVLLRLRHGTYVDREFYQALSETERHLIAGRAVLARLGDGVALANVSAAVFHGIELYRPSLQHVHVVHLDGSGGRTEAGVIHHEGRVLPDADLTVVGGILAVSPARAGLEVAMTSGTESGVVAVSSALHHGLTTKHELAELEPRFTQWPGFSHARLATRIADDRIESVGESRSLFHMWRQGVPRPRLQTRIYGPRGHELGRVDYDWEFHRHVGEFDGFKKYSAYGDGREALIKEKQREDQIRATGRGMSRWTWNDLAPSRVAGWARELSAALEHSRRQFTRGAAHIPVS